MPDQLGITINDEKVKKFFNKFVLQSMANVFIRPMNESIVLIVKHAKKDHYFVGTGKGASKRAKEHELDFKNPDGSLRWKVRTQALLNSIQSQDAKLIGGSVVGTISVGMEYAKKIEYGAPGRRAFPFLRPALEANRHTFFERMKEALKGLSKGK